MIEIDTIHNLKPDYLTADGDTKISKVTKEMGIEINRDVRHLSKNITKKKQTVDLSDFKGHNRSERLKEWNLYKASIIKRCNAENKKVHLKTKDLKGAAKLSKVKSYLKDTPKAILACHQNKCAKLCQKHSHVCSGYGSKKY